MNVIVIFSSNHDRLPWSCNCPKHWHRWLRNIDFLSRKRISNCEVHVADIISCYQFIVRVAHTQHLFWPLPKIVLRVLPICGVVGALCSKPPCRGYKSASYLHLWVVSLRSCSPRLYVPDTSQKKTDTK